MSTRTAMGKFVDFAVLVAKHGDAIAVGNAGMNARGDLIDAQGKVLKKVAEVEAEYNRSKAEAARAVPLTALTADVFQSPAEAMQQHTEAEAKAKAKPAAARKITDSGE